MLLEVFSIFDKCSGIYSEPFTAVNKDVASRRFKQICISSPVIASDLQLYRLGSFDSQLGIISYCPLGKPEFLEGGVANDA